MIAWDWIEFTGKLTLTKLVLSINGIRLTLGNDLHLKSLYSGIHKSRRMPKNPTVGFENLSMTVRGSLADD